MSLTNQQTEKFHKILLHLKQQLLHSLNENNEEVKESEQSKGYSQHQADEGTDDFVKMVTLEVSSQGYSLLRQIDRALEKIKEGTYGICDISGNAIPIKRLEAIPYATMTVEAQQHLEKDSPHEK